MTILDKIIAIYPNLTSDDFGPRNAILLRNDSDGCGDYIAKWEHPIYPQPTEEQLASVVVDENAEIAKDARAKRNALLAACDWTQLPDAPVDAAAWAAYRQALRDISDQAGFPSNIDWPVQP